MMTTEIEDALALVDTVPAKTIEWMVPAGKMCQWCQPREDVSEAAARILAAEVRRLRALVPVTHKSELPTIEQVQSIYADHKNKRASEEIDIDCPARQQRSKDYPERFHGRVPKTVKMLETVRSEYQLASGRMVALAGAVYAAWTNIHGAVAVVVKDGQKLGVKPDEFEVVSWY